MSRPSRKLQALNGMRFTYVSKGYCNGFIDLIYSIEFLEEFISFECSECGDFSCEDCIQRQDVIKCRKLGHLRLGSGKFDIVFERVEFNDQYPMSFAITKDMWILDSSICVKRDIPSPGMFSYVTLDNIRYFLNPVFLIATNQTCSRCCRRDVEKYLIYETSFKICDKCSVRYINFVEEMYQFYKICLSAIQQNTGFHNSDIAKTILQSYFYFYQVICTNQN